MSFAVKLLLLLCNCWLYLIVLEKYFSPGKERKTCVPSLELLIGLLALARARRLPLFRLLVDHLPHQNLGDQRSLSDCRAAAAPQAGILRGPGHPQSWSVDCSACSYIQNIMVQVKNYSSRLTSAKNPIDWFSCLYCFLTRSQKAISASVVCPSHQTPFASSISWVARKYFLIACPLK